MWRIMIRHLSADFESDHADEVEGGGKVEGSLLTVEEFDGLREVGYYRMSKGVQFKPHRHKDWLVITVLKGRLRVETLGHEDEVFQPGDTYLVEPGHVHTETAVEDNTVVLVTQGSKDFSDFPMHTVEV